jgi:hypothetical protein
MGMIYLHHRPVLHGIELWRRKVRAWIGVLREDSLIVSCEIGDFYCVGRGSTNVDGLTQIAALLMPVVRRYSRLGCRLQLHGY